MNAIRCYTDLTRLKTLEERAEYLMLNGKVGEELFGYARELAQRFYHSAEWRDVHDAIVIRDDGCELGVPGYKINGSIYVHHINPATIKQFMENDPELLNPENLISCSFRMHQAITFGIKDLIPNQKLIVRRPGDTCPWK